MAEYGGEVQTDGSPRKDHGHIFVLPSDEDGDGRLDHITVFTRERFEALETVAIDRVRELWQPDGRPALQCIPVRWGQRAEVLSNASKVRTVTPFIPLRHWRKGRGEFPEWLLAEVQRECGNHGLRAPATAKVVPLLELAGGRKVRWLEFRRNRKGDEPKVGYRLDLDFGEATVETPFAIGYGCHFGLGQFRGV